MTLRFQPARMAVANVLQDIIIARDLGSADKSELSGSLAYQISDERQAALNETLRVLGALPLAGNAAARGPVVASPMA